MEVLSFWRFLWFGRFLIFGRLVGFCFWHFAEFCQFIPSPICKFLNFRVGLFIVQLETSTALIFIFLKALEWMWLLTYCNFIFDFVIVFFIFSLAFTIDFFIN